tara:strand:+ start:1686 stop:2141 length:456 start_codon:yes stop_codon:yes gene_type:complete
MQNNIGRIIFGWVIIISTGMFGYWIGKNTNNTQSQPEKELQKIIDYNTHSIQSLAIAAKTQSNNADILLQILNVLEGKAVKELPRSINGLFLSDMPDFEVEDGDNDIPLTFDQVTKDQLELDLGIRSLASGNLFQADTLHNILRKIKDREQ